MLEAASTIKKEAFADIILVGKESEIESLAKDNNIDINGVTIIDPLTFCDSEKLINDYYELRKHKGISLEQDFYIVLLLQHVLLLYYFFHLNLQWFYLLLIF